MRLHLTIPASSLICSLGSAHALQTRQPRAINWTSCQNNATVPWTCGTLEVPLDYANIESTKTLNLSLIKIAAPKQPSKGSILFNPGGPGAGGRDFVAGFAETLIYATGGYYDLVGFDPRGTSDTIPISCYKDDTTRAIANASTPLLANSSDTAVGDLWAASKLFADSCYENARDYSEFVGTAFVARDMMQIVDALNEDGMLRYWGTSYGSVLGATVAAMFPDRMDKVVLDGVVDLHEYYHGIDVPSVTDSDAVLAGFFSGCIVNPDLCPLARQGVTEESLSQEFHQYLDHLKYDPVAVAVDDTSTIVNYDLVKNAIIQALYAVAKWPKAASMLGALYDGDYPKAALQAAQLSAVTTLFPPGHESEAMAAIYCSDSSARTPNLGDVQPIVDEFRAKSFIAGDALDQLVFQCMQWRFEAKERYQGNFQDVRTRNPVLFVGATYDMATPLISAQNVSAGFKDSVVLQHNGYGHTSLGQPSICTADAISAYFNGGVLPAPGTICEPVVPAFSNKTFSDVFAPLIANRTK